MYESPPPLFQSTLSMYLHVYTRYYGTIPEQEKQEMRVRVGMVTKRGRWNAGKVRVLSWSALVSLHTQPGQWLASLPPDSEHLKLFNSTLRRLLHCMLELVLALVL